MCIFEIPSLLFYFYGPTIIAGSLLGIFIYLSNRKDATNRYLFIFIVFFCLWSVISMLGWIVKDIETSLFLARISVLEIVSLVFFLFFVYSLIGINLSIKKRFLFFLPFVPIFLFIFTDHNSYMSDISICETQNGALYWYVYFLALIYTIWPISILVRYYRCADIASIKRKQIRLIGFSIIFLVAWFMFFLVITSLSLKWSYFWGDNIFLFTPIGILIFISIVTYAITKYQFLNIKLIAAKALTYAIWILIASQYFFVQAIINILLITLTLLIAFLFGRFLINSVEREVEQKEELEALSQQLVEANIQLKKLDKAKSEFISIASHQLRTPLTAIKGYLSLVVEGSYGQVDDSVKNALQKAYGANERLILLVEDLLNASRIESGRMKYDLADVHLEDLVSQSCDSLTLKAKDEGLFLKVNAPKNPLPVFHVDGNKVREVISNFIDNAIKYTEKGGVEVGFESDSESVKIVISDTGIGVPKDEIPYLFKKFSRGKNTSRLNATGTGLGLFVAKNIIEAHGGKVWVKSDGAGKGSCFYIQLPLKWIDPNTNAEVGMKEEE